MADEAPTNGNPGDKQGLAGYIGRLVAVVTAITTLLASLTALTVAAKAGWSEVGPYFANFFAHGEVSIPDKSSGGSTDGNEPAVDIALLNRLESSDSAVRRDARSSLAQAVATMPPSEVDKMIGQLVDSPSYRVQLGIAVAMHNAPGGWSSSDPAAAEARLRALAARTSDETLRAELESAASAQRQ